MPHPLVLDRNAYYSPLPMVTVDGGWRIIDFNLALQSLLADHIPLIRYQSLPQAVAAVRQLLVGHAVPIASDPGKDLLVATDVRETTLHLTTVLYGRVDLHRTLLPCCDHESGKVLGATFYLQILALAEADRFRHHFVSECGKQLTWEEYAVSYDRILNLMPYYQEVVGRHFRAMTADDIRRVADIGAGTGNLVERLIRTGRHVTAVELSRAMLNRLRSKIPTDLEERLTAIEQNAESLAQIASGSFDGVSVLLALFDMDTPEAALAEAVRVLRAGGRVVITEPKLSFRMEPILQGVEQRLRTLGRFAELQADMRRVFHANQIINPSSRATRSPLRAEVILERLQGWGFRELTIEDSHFGNCATVSGTKP